MRPVCWSYETSKFHTLNSFHKGYLILLKCVFCESLLMHITRVFVSFLFYIYYRCCCCFNFVWLRILMACGIIRGKHGMWLWCVKFGSSNSRIFFHQSVETAFQITLPGNRIVGILPGFFQAVYIFFFCKI